MKHKGLLEVAIPKVEQPESAQRIEEIVIRQGLEHIHGERGILVRERKVAWRNMDSEIEALLIQHVLHVPKGLELGVLRVDF